MWVNFHLGHKASYVGIPFSSMGTRPGVGILFSSMGRRPVMWEYPFHLWAQGQLCGNTFFIYGHKASYERNILFIYGHKASCVGIPFLSMGIRPVMWKYHFIYGHKASHVGKHFSSMGTRPVLWEYLFIYGHKASHVGIHFSSMGTRPVTWEYLFIYGHKAMWEYPFHLWAQGQLLGNTSFIYGHKPRCGNILFVYEQKATYVGIPFSSIGTWPFMWEYPFHLWAQGQVCGNTFFMYGYKVTYVEIPFSSMETRPVM